MNNFDGTASEKIGFMFTKVIEMFSEEPSKISVIFSEEIFKNEDILKNKIIEIVGLQAQTIESIILKGQLKKN
ncbi:MAG: hypothetical protein IPL46_02510 [Saprospiraceae bacterium]|nr:hypothetical protein [Saprospiraceae bacterium]